MLRDPAASLVPAAPIPVHAPLIGPRPTQPFEPFEPGAIEQSIPARFAQQVARYPTHIAVKHGEVSVTYTELNREANRIAHAIIEHAGTAAVPVVILIDQGITLVASILGVLKAGKIYVPLDVCAPDARLAALIEACGAQLVLANKETMRGAERVAANHARVLRVDAIDACTSRDDPRQPISPGAVAYVYYTSGTTGQPKGVCDSHRNVLHNVMRYTNTLHINADDRLTLLQGPSFSGAVSSLFAALLNGATSYPFDVAREGTQSIGEWLAREAITIYHSVPALFRQVATSGVALPRLRLIRLEGDGATPADIELFRRHFAPGTLLVNGLGATECGIVRQFFVDRDTPVPTPVVPIGYPVPDMEVHVLDESGEPVPPNIVGEIAVRSRYLALGYWQRPDLTDRAFESRDGVRQYRTGDLGRLDESGCLVHLGRKDFQLKIDGHRIELEAVEAALRELPAIGDALAMTREDVPGRARLVAYLVRTTQGAAAPSTSALRRHLLQRVPRHMIPSRYVWLDALPLNANAKLDRRALPAPSDARPALETGYARPASLLHRQLIRLWEEELSIAPVGIHDDFFELGGSSLDAVRMIERVERMLGLRAPLAGLLERATIAHLAEVVQTQPGAAPAAIVPIHPDGTKTPFFFLHGDYLSGGFYCTELAAELGPDQPLYVLPPAGLDGGPIPHSYEAMADAHLRDVRATQPRGPYRLGGLCNGGLVALEIARRLIAAGEQVERLILLGASAINVRWRLAHGPIGLLGAWFRNGPTERFDRFVDYVLYWDSLPRAQRSRLLGAKLGTALAAFAGLFGPKRPVGPSSIVPSSAALGADEAWTPLRGVSSMLGPRAEAIRKRYRDLDKAYAPRPYPGAVTLVWPEDDFERALATHWWREVTPQVSLHTVPGSHGTMLALHMRAVARTFARLLEDHDGTGP